EDEILQQRRATQAGLEAVLVVGNRHALVGGQALAGAVVAYAGQRTGGGVLAGNGRSTGLAGLVALADGAGRGSGGRRRLVLAFRRSQGARATMLGGLVGV